MATSHSFSARESSYPLISGLMVWFVTVNPTCARLLTSLNGSRTSHITCTRDPWLHDTYSSRVACGLVKILTRFCPCAFFNGLISISSPLVSSFLGWLANTRVAAWVVFLPQVWLFVLACSKLGYHCVHLTPSTQTAGSHSLTECLASISHF